MWFNFLRISEDASPTSFRTNINDDARHSEQSWFLIFLAASKIQFMQCLKKYRAVSVNDCFAHMRLTVLVQPSARDEPLVDSNFCNFQDFRRANKSHHDWARSETHTDEVPAHEIFNSDINARDTRSHMEPKLDSSHIHSRKGSIAELYFRYYRFTVAPEKLANNRIRNFEIFYAQQ